MDIAQPNTGHSPKVPPPPVEVGIRTMASDIEAVRESGGEPQFLNAQVPHAFTPEKSRMSIFWIVGAAVLAVAFFLVGYFLIFPLFGR